MRIYYFLILAIFISNQGKSQDSLFTRTAIKYLCSEKCFGRGYLKNGQHRAESYIISEIKKSGANPLFGAKYYQSFYHPVNTFPKECRATINGKNLIPGKDFIPKPDAPGTKGHFKLTRRDSVTFISSEVNPAVEVVMKDKLTFSVAKTVATTCVIEVDKNQFGLVPEEIEVHCENKLIANFESRNLGCFIDGNSPSDSLIVFTAHYDHLGGIGKQVYFPGANDNASGVSMVLNLIKHYHTIPPKYRTLFIFFAGEEAGLLGSKHFVENSPIDLKKIKFLVNLDLLGTGDEGIMVVNGAVFDKQFTMLTQLNDEKHLLPVIKKRGKAANSDHYWFSETGVPCFFIYTMGGIKAYHDIYDVEKTLPLTAYHSVFELLTSFVEILK